MTATSVLSTVDQAIADYRDGRFVIIVDDEDRENEGDLTMAGQFVTSAHINFMAGFARGLICAPMSHARVEELGLPMMVPANQSLASTPFTISVEAASGVTTGISAADRAKTVQVLADPASTSMDITMPGHLFPLRARPGGVLERRGQTEAVVDLCLISGLVPVGVLCEIMRKDGSMARLPYLRQFAYRHDIRIISVDQISTYRSCRLD